MSTSGKLRHGNVTIKQRKFVTNYIQNGLNGAKAIRDAGYETDAVNSTTLACQTLKHPAVKKLVEKEVRRLEKDFGLTFDYKIKKLKKILDNTIPDDDCATPEHYRVGISAISELNKMQGHHAAEKRVNLNLQTDANIDQLRSVMDELVKKHTKDY